MANESEKTVNPAPPDYVTDALQDAERLLKYTAEIGVEVDPAMRDNILRARTAVTTGWDQKTVADLLAALTQLAARLKPVTAESLKASSERQAFRPTFEWYKTMSICLAVIIILFSLASFITNAISKTISTDITTANDLASKLRAQLGAETAPTQTNDASLPPPGMNAVEIINELQLYAATIRSIDARSRQLNWFVFSYERDPFRNQRTNSTELRKTFQLDVGLPNLRDAAEGRTRVYQDVRSLAQKVLDDVSLLYGGIAACVLPVLYALLGTCAYLLRSFEQQMITRTFIPSTANSARFLIAGIGGAVVGLFNYTITQGASISPLAIAFLVGYAVDVFFAFLEGLLQTFTRKALPS